MEVLYRLCVDSSDVNSVMLKDGEVQYPVFMGCLHLDNVFKSLLSSGYKFCGLPYDFRKDGRSILDLPVQPYNPTEDEMQDMFDMNSMPTMGQDELRKYLSQEDVKYVAEPEAEYTINTRQEFIEYLNTYKTMRNRLDVRPINYFVHPSARFTVDEWKSGEFDEYFRTMEVRRNMSWDAFQYLRNWLTIHGMDPMADATGIVKAYCAWGIDGLNTKFINKQQQSMLIQEDYILTDSVDPDAYDIHRYDFALIDRYGAIFPPEDVVAGFGGWKVAVKHGLQSSYVKDLLSKLREGQYGVVPIKTKASEEVLFFNGLKDTIRVTPYEIKCGTARVANLVVHMPDVVGKTIPQQYWSAKYNERIMEMSNLYAVAYDILGQTKITADVSTFQALELVGCDIRGCIQYVLDKTQPDPTDEDAVAEYPTAEELNLFLERGYETEGLSSVAQLRFDTIEDIVTGAINTDAIGSGIKLDAMVDVDTIYKYLYCAHFCKTKVSVNDIYKLTRNVREHAVEVPFSLDTGKRNAQVLQLKSDVFTIDVPCTEQKGKIKGFYADLDKYTDSQANQCCGFLKVVRVAKEFGTRDRHVAFEALTVNLLRDGKVAARNLDALIEIYGNIIDHAPVQYRSVHHELKRRICMGLYFSVAEEGVLRVPASLSTEPYPVPQDLVNSIRSTIKPKITSTALYCSKMYADGCFTHYCVNADITPYHVYPKETFRIPAAPLPGLWYDWNSMGAPAIRQKLIDAGIISMTFVPWTNRYLSEMYFSPLGYIKEANLAIYMNYCNDYRAKTKLNEEFLGAPHIEELLYPGVHDSQCRIEHETPLRKEGELPPLVVSNGEILTYEKYGDRTALKTRSVNDNDSAVRPFSGFKAEDFDMLGDVSKVKLPMNNGDHYFVVNNDAENPTFEADGTTYNSISYLSQFVNKDFPIVNIWGRKYLFCDLFGTMWEAVI